MTVPADATGERVVAVDLGGTKIAAAAADRDGRLGPVITRPTPAHQGPDRVLAAIAKAVRQIRDAHPGVVAVGLGAAGVIDTATGTVLSATDAITDWPGTAVTDTLERELGLPVAVDNDVNAHAVGEAWTGAGRNFRTVLMVAAGTGVGGAVILDGEPLHGAHHVAGEIGHMPARGADHLTCGCGRRGHLEAIASGPGLLRHYHWLGGHAAAVDARAVIEAARGGDPAAVRAVRESADALGRCLAGMVVLVDPDVVVVGGGLAGAGDVWWQPMEDTLRAELIDVAAGVPVRAAQLGATAALVGAARRAWARPLDSARAPAEPDVAG